MQKLSVFCRTLQPTAFHHALQVIAREGRVQRIYSQNIDGLEEVAGLSVFPFTSPRSVDAQVIALHGSVRYLAAAPHYDHQQYYRGGDEVTDQELKQGKEPLCPECELTLQKYSVQRHCEAAKMHVLSHAVCCSGDNFAIASKIDETAIIDKDQADLLVIAGASMTKSLQHLIQGLLSRSTLPKCLIINSSRFANNNLPKFLVDKSIVFETDCQLLATKILQDSVVNSPWSVCPMYSTLAID
jgi:NAD-dependent SIR2 family protein deacetylase